MLSLYRKKVPYDRSSSIIFIESVPKLEPLPLTTVDFKSTTSRALLNNLADVLRSVRTKLDANDKSFYNSIEQFLAIGPTPIGYRSISSMNIQPTYTKKEFKAISERVDSEISKCIAPFQMRLSTSELDIVVNLFMVYSGATVYRADKKLTLNELRLVFKRPIHVNTSSEKHLLHADVDASAVKRHALLTKYNIREHRNVTYVQPSEPTFRPVLSKQRIKPMPLKPIFEYLDERYKGTLMYINTYISLCMEDARALYVDKSFRTPRYEEFEDTDLSLCTFDTFYDATSRLISAFNRTFKFNVVL